MEFSEVKLGIDTYPSNGNVVISNMSVTYSQEADCTEGREAEDQTLTISTRDGGGGLFINIKTGENGWSLDRDSSSIEKDLVSIVQDFCKRLTYNTK